MPYSKLVVFLKNKSLKKSYKLTRSLCHNGINFMKNPNLNPLCQLLLWEKKKRKNHKIFIFYMNN